MVVAVAVVVVEAAILDLVEPGDPAPARGVAVVEAEEEERGRPRCCWAVLVMEDSCRRGRDGGLVAIRSAIADVRGRQWDAGVKKREREK